jgi:hypothetical protein
LRRELKAAARPRVQFVVRTVLGLMLASIGLVAVVGPLDWDGVRTAVHG